MNMALSLVLPSYCFVLIPVLTRMLPGYRQVRFKNWHPSNIAQLVECLPSMHTRPAEFCITI